MPTERVNIRVKWNELRPAMFARAATSMGSSMSPILYSRKRLLPARWIATVGTFAFP